MRSPPGHVNGLDKPESAPGLRPQALPERIPSVSAHLLRRLCTAAAAVALSGAAVAPLAAARPARADNPYAGAGVYVNPEWSARAAAEPGGSIDRYRSEFIDPIAAVLADPAYAGLRIVTTIGPGALPDLAINTGSTAGATARCNAVKSGGACPAGIG